MQVSAGELHLPAALNFDEKLPVIVHARQFPSRDLSRLISEKDPFTKKGQAAAIFLHESRFKNSFAQVDQCGNHCAQKSQPLQGQGAMGLNAGGGEHSLVIRRHRFWQQINADSQNQRR